MKRLLSRLLAASLALNLLAESVPAMGYQAAFDAPARPSLSILSVKPVFEEEALVCAVAYGTLHVLLPATLSVRHALIHALLFGNGMALMASTLFWPQYISQKQWRLLAEDTRGGHRSAKLDKRLRPIAPVLRQLNILLMGLQNSPHHAQDLIQPIIEDARELQTWVDHNEPISWETLMPIVQERILDAMQNGSEENNQNLSSLLVHLVPLFSGIPQKSVRDWTWRRVSTYLLRSSQEHYISSGADWNKIPIELQTVAIQINNVITAIMEPSLAHPSVRPMDDLASIEKWTFEKELKWGAPRWTILPDLVQSKIKRLIQDPKTPERHVAVQFLKLLDGVPKDVYIPELADLRLEPDEHPFVPIPRLAIFSVTPFKDVAPAQGAPVQYQEDINQSVEFLNAIAKNPSWVHGLRFRDYAIHEISVMGTGFEMMQIHRKSSRTTLYIPLDMVKTIGTNEEKIEGLLEKGLTLARDYPKNPPGGDGIGVFMGAIGLAGFELMARYRIPSVILVGVIGIAIGLVGLAVIAAFMISESDWWRWRHVRRALRHPESRSSPMRDETMWQAELDLSAIEVAIRDLQSDRLSLDPLERIDRALESLTLWITFKGRIPWSNLSPDIRSLLENGFAGLDAKGPRLALLDPYLTPLLGIFEGIPPRFQRGWAWGQVQQFMRGHKNHSIPRALLQTTSLLTILESILSTPISSHEEYSDLIHVLDQLAAEVRANKRQWGMVPWNVLERDIEHSLIRLSASNSKQGKALHRQLDSIFADHIRISRPGNTRHRPSGKGNKSATIVPFMPPRPGTPKRKYDFHYGLAFAGLAGILVGGFYAGALAPAFLLAAVLVGINIYGPPEPRLMSSWERAEALYEDLRWHIEPDLVAAPHYEDGVPTFKMIKKLSPDREFIIIFRGDRVFISNKHNGVPTIVFNFGPMSSRITTFGPGGTKGAQFIFPQSHAFRGFAFDHTGHLYVVVTDDFQSYFAKTRQIYRDFRVLPIAGFLSPADLTGRLMSVDLVKGSDLVTPTHRTLAIFRLPKRSEPFESPKRNVDRLVSEPELPAKAEDFLEYLDGETIKWPGTPDDIHIVIGLAHSPEIFRITYEEGEGGGQWHTITIPLSIIPENPEKFPQLMAEVTRSLPDAVKLYLMPTQRSTATQRTSTPLPVGIKSDAQMRIDAWQQVARILQMGTFEGVSFSDALRIPTSLLIELREHVAEIEKEILLEVPFEYVWTELETWVMLNQQEWGKIPWWVLPSSTQLELDRHSEGNSTGARGLKRYLESIFELPKSGEGGAGGGSGTTGLRSRAMALFNLIRPTSSSRPGLGRIHRSRLPLTAA